MIAQYVSQESILLPLPVRLAQYARQESILQASDRLLALALALFLVFQDLLVTSLIHAKAVLQDIFHHQEQVVKVAQLENFPPTILLLV